MRRVNPYLRTRPFQSRRDVTVCVATMANNGTIFGAADRMLTRGTTQSEPKWAKIYNFAEPLPVTVMWAGNSAVFAEIMQFCINAATDKPEKIKRIQDYVDLFCNSVAAFTGKRAERAILTRLGLTMKDLTSSKVPTERAMRFVEQVTTYATLLDEDVAVIIAGHDDTGPHIWSTQNDVLSCHDVEGFAVIGSGADHADAQLRFAGFSRQATPQEALIMAWMAKRRADRVAPHVGRTTDLVMRAAGNQWMMIDQNWIKAFDGEYDKYLESEKEALRTAVDAVANVMAEKAGAFTQPALQPNQEEAPQSQPESTHDQ